MRFGFAVVFLAALAFSPSAVLAGEDFSTKQGCLAAMSYEVGVAQAWQRVPEIKSRGMESAPDSAKERVSVVISAYEEISRQYQIIADGLFEICGKYD